MFFKKNDFAKNVAILAGGTAFSQVLVVTLSPIITRLYTPEDFGTLAIFIAILAILSTSASLKYHLAIPLAEKDEDAVQLLVLSLSINVLYGVLAGVFLYLFTPVIREFENLKVIIPFLWIIPISIIAVGFYQSLKYWAIREGKFRHIARTKVSQNVTLLGMQIGLGLITTGPIGLLLGDAFGRSGGSTTLAVLAWKKIRRLSKEISLKRIREQAIRFKRFPMYSSFSGFFNSSGVQITPLLMAGILGPVVAGFYALTQRVAGAPLKLIGQNYSQVYYKEALKNLKVSRSALKRLYLKQSKILFLIGLMPAIIIVIIGVNGFEFIFGEGWGESGLYAQIIAPMLVAQFAVVPLSQTLNILERQDLQLLWDVLRFFAILLSFGAIYYFSIEAHVAIIIISGVMVLLYGLLYLITLKEVIK